MACCAVDRSGAEMDEGIDVGGEPMTGADVYYKWKKDMTDKGLLLQIRARYGEETEGWGMFEESNVSTDLNRGYISSKLHGYAMMIAVIFDDLELFQDLYKYMKKAIEENNGHKAHGLMAKHLMGTRNTTARPHVFEYVNFEHKRNSTEADFSVLMALFLAVRAASTPHYSADWADMTSECSYALKAYGKALVENSVVEQEDVEGEKFKFFAESANSTGENQWYPSIIDFHVCAMMTQMDPTQLRWKEVVKDNSQLLQKVLGGVEWLVGAGPQGQDVASASPEEVAKSDKVGYCPSKLPVAVYSWTMEKKLSFYTGDFVELKNLAFTMDGVLLLYRLSNYLNAHVADQEKPSGYEDVRLLCQSMCDALGYMAKERSLRVAGGAGVNVNIYKFTPDAHNCSAVVLMALAGMLATGALNDKYDLLGKIKELSGYPFLDRDTLKYAENGCMAMLFFASVERKDDSVLSGYFKGEVGEG